MLKILHSGIQPSFDIDKTGLTGDVEQDLKSAYLNSLVGGRLFGLDANGNVQLADGDPANPAQPIGFLILNATGYFFENKPALASGKVAGTLGNCVVITDQIVTSETFAPGDALYAGTGANVGLVTKTAPAAGAKQIGIAGSAASAAAPELKILV